MVHREAAAAFIRVKAFERLGTDHPGLALDELVRVAKIPSSCTPKGRDRLAGIRGAEIRCCWNQGFHHPAEFKRDPIDRVVARLAGEGPGLSRSRQLELFADLDLWTLQLPRGDDDHGHRDFGDFAAREVRQAAERFVKAVRDAIDDITAPFLAPPAGAEPFTPPDNLSLPRTMLHKVYEQSLVDIEIDGEVMTFPRPIEVRLPRRQTPPWPLWPFRDGVWVVTAHNPGGIVCSAEWNDKAHRRLEERVAKNSWHPLPAVGRSADGSWAETSLAFPGVSEWEAIDLAIEFGQLAVFGLVNGHVDVVETGIHYPKEDQSVGVGPAFVHMLGHEMISSRPCLNCGVSEDAHIFDEDDYDKAACPDGNGILDVCDPVFLVACGICNDGMAFHGEGGCSRCDCPGFYVGPDCGVCGRSPLDHEEEFAEFDDYDPDDEEGCPGYETPDEFVALDSASAETLMSLPGVGHKTALDIIRGRPLTSMFHAMGINPRAMNKALGSGRIWI